MGAGRLEEQSVTAAYIGELNAASSPGLALGGAHTGWICGFGNMLVSDGFLLGRPSQRKGENCPEREGTGTVHPSNYASSSVVHMAQPIRWEAQATGLNLTATSIQKVTWPPKFSRFGGLSPSNPSRCLLQVLIETPARSALMVPVWGGRKGGPRIRRKAGR